MGHTSSLRLDASHVRIGGRISGPLARPAGRVVVRAASTCRDLRRFGGTVVARSVRVARDGSWLTTVALPPELQGGNIVLRAQSRVPRTPGGRRTFRTFTLIQSSTAP
jgi:hypothetical protein